MKIVTTHDGTRLIGVLTDSYESVTFFAPGKLNKIVDKN